MENSLYIPPDWELPPTIRRRLGHSVGKQRLMDEDGHMLLLLHQVPRAEDDEVRTAMVAWRDPAGEWKSAPATGGISGLEAHISSYRKAIHQLDDQVETAKTAREFFDVMRHMHPLQRATRSMLGVMQETREALPDDVRIINLRDQAADLERAIELVAADAKAGMDFTMAESANKQAISSDAANREARRLNRLAAFFLPLATLVAVFGMNPPESIYGNPGFWIVLGAGLVAGVAVTLAIGYGCRNNGDG